MNDQAVATAKAAVARQKAATPEAADRAVANVKTFIDKYQSQIQQSMMRGLDKQQLMSVLYTTVRMNPGLLKCTEVSLIGSLLQANHLGLRLDSALGQAYLIPRQNRKRGVTEAQFMVGYRGMLDLARRSGEIESIMAQVVRDGDKFSYEYGTNEHLAHVPSAEHRGKILFVYAYAKFKKGGVVFEVLSREEVEKIRQTSAAKDDGPWATHWEEMARKTVLRRLSKYLPLTVEAAKAVELEEQADVGQAWVLDESTGEIAAERVEAAEEVKPVQEQAADEVKPALGPAEAHALRSATLRDVQVKKVARVQKPQEMVAIVSQTRELVTTGDMTEADAALIMDAANKREAELTAPKGESK